MVGSPGRLLSVNVAELRLIEVGGRAVETGIYKEPVSGPVRVGELGVDGDLQADRSVHGGQRKAVYAYAAEDYEWWSSELDRELGPGAFGENLTVAGVDLSGTLVGERWRVGSVLLEASELRQPCSKLGQKIGDTTIIKRFARAHRPGAYFRVIEAGELGAGAEVEVVDRPDHEASMELMSRVVLGERDLVPKLLAAEALSPRWREWARRRRA